ncbi:MAG: nickel-binding protein [Gammaproteobacteria bacterium]
MEWIVVERDSAEPIDIDAYFEAGRQGEGCFRLYRVRHRASVLADDGRRMVCAFQAPDAEAVRSVARTLGRPAAVAWPASQHPVPGREPRTGDRIVLVERDLPAAPPFEALQSIEDAGAACLAARRVEFLCSWFARSRRRMLCMYRAPDAESVRIAQRTIGMPFTRAWAATWHAQD